MTQTNRHSIRLKKYDYSQTGLYFVTVCSYNKKNIFGEIEDGEVYMNDTGVMADECWQTIPRHFTNTVLHEYIIMPNHVHGIIEIIKPAGARHFSPNIEHISFKTQTQNSTIHNDVIFTDRARMNAMNGAGSKRAKDVSPLRQCGTSQTVGSIVRGFKIGVTKWLRNNLPEYYPKNKSVWQRNYYEHIIRNEPSYQNITNYIINNPSTWIKDKLWKTIP